MPILVRSLQKSDQREEFHSGQPELDLFFHRHAGQNQFRHHIGVTYIATDETTIYGYITLATGSLDMDRLPSTIKLPANYPLPILRVGRLAVDSRHQNRGVGKLLLRYAFEVALNLRDSVGCVGILVDAKPDAVSFYERYSFRVLDELVEGAVRAFPRPVPMFLSIKSIPVP